MTSPRRRISRHHRVRCNRPAGTRPPTPPTWFATGTAFSTDDYADPADKLAEAAPKKPPLATRFGVLPGPLTAVVIVPLLLIVFFGLVYVGPIVSDWWDEATEPLEDKMRWSRETCGPDEARGSVRNTSDETVVVFLEIKFLSGTRLVETMTASVRGLSPGQLGEWSTFSPSESWNTCTVSVKSAYES